MGLQFNPFSGTFDFVGSGGGGGSSYIDGEVATFADLPLDGSAALNSAWLVREASGTWLIARKPAGIYIRTATGGTDRNADYTYAGIMPDVFNDANFLIYDNSDSTKNLQFQLSGISTGQTRVLTAPDASGTISLTGHTHAAADVTSGTFDNARINFAAPPAIGSTTGAAGTFTTLTGSTQVVGPQGSTVGSSSDCAITLGAANTGFNISSTQLVALKQGANVWYANNSGRFVVAAGMNNGMDIEATGAPINFSARTSLQPESNNVLAVRNGTSAQEYRVYGTYTSSTNYQRMTIKSVKQTLSALSGASATTTGTFIPDGAVVVGVTTRVATALTGASGYQVGDGTDADRWGDVTGTAIGTTSDNVNWTAGTIECFTAGGNVTLTAKTANFTAGAIEICVFYLAGEAD